MVFHIYYRAKEFQASTKGGELNLNHPRRVELIIHNEQRMCTLVPPPEDHPIIGTKWVFKNELASALNNLSPRRFLVTQVIRMEEGNKCKAIKLRSRKELSDPHKNHDPKKM